MIALAMMATIFGFLIASVINIFGWVRKSEFTKLTKDVVRDRTREFRESSRNIFE